MGRSWRWGLIVVSLTGCAEDSDSTSGTPTESVAVELVGPGVVSTGLPEFSAALTRGGDTLFFNRTPPDRSRLDLYVAVRVAGEWTEALPFEPTEGIVAIDPFLSPDGRRLYFSSNGAVGGGTGASFNIWFVDRSDGAWGPPSPLPPPIRSDSSDVFNSFSADGTLIFSSTRDGERRIYQATPVGSGWSEPVGLTFGGLTGASNPMISPDGRFMVLAAAGPDQGIDLFVSCRVEDGWAEPVRLPSPINSSFTDFAPAIAGEHLYFTSERPGVVGPQPDSVRPPGDIYRTNLANAQDVCRDGRS